MATLDVDSLLAPLTPDHPCGENLEYEPTFIEFEDATRGKPDAEYGETVIPAEEPDWKQAKRLGLELVAKSKDLRVICLLSRALLRTDGPVAFRDALSLIHGYISTYWETVHPQLDPEDDNDPTIRVNAIASLADRNTTLAALYDATLVETDVLGTFSFTDIRMAQGEITPPEGEPVPDMSTIESAFASCELDSLRETTMAMGTAISLVEAIDQVLTEQVGAANSVSLEKLSTALGEIHEVLAERLARRDIQAGEDAQGLPTEAQAGDAAQGALARVADADIRSREDVIQALDKVCRYYDRYEPSSPLPLLLRRAKRLASKNFVEIVRDLTPDALAQVESIAGLDGDSGGD